MLRMTALGRYRTDRPALNPCGAGRGDQSECRNVSGKRMSAPREPSKTANLEVEQRDTEAISEKPS